MKEQAHGGTYTLRGHIHTWDIHLNEQTYGGDIHRGDIGGGNIYGGYIHMKE